MDGVCGEGGERGVRGVRGGTGEGRKKENIYRKLLRRRGGRGRMGFLREGGGGMSKARELLWTCLEELQYYEVPCPELINEVKELLTQPEPFKPDWVGYRQGFEDGLLSKGGNLCLKKESCCN